MGASPMPTRDAAASAAPSGAMQGAGQLLGPQSNEGSADMRQLLESSTKRFRDVMAEVDSLAGSFPSAAKDLRAAAESLKSALMKATSELTKQQPQQPEQAAA